MKLTRIISLMLVFVMLTLTLASCNLGEWIAKIQGKNPEQSTPSATSPTITGNGGSLNPDEDDWDSLYDIITIAKALEIAKAEESTNPTVRYYVRGTIVNVSNPAYGEMTIADETGEIYVYGTYSADGSVGYADFDEKPVKGDEVLLHCTLNKYNSEPQVKNARLIDFKKADKEDVDTSDYTKMAIGDAREAALGTKISVTGVVARITYANGMKPSGVYLVDDSNSIYVYDADIAGQVKIGNKITVLGSKDYWVLESEQANAEKYGYKGCCQISDATLYENDNGTNEINFSWCKEAAVKKILELPVTDNYTTTIFKTTALVKKVPGSGFVNYYFYDLDGATGSYTYTQCNGSDFAWLDEFDGKICTVYLSIINAKSTSSGYQYRFLPVAVIDEGFEFDLSRTPMHLVEYYGVEQFISIYMGNPMLEVVTSVSSELLGFENASLSYTSSDESIAYFEEKDGKLIFNCVENGTVTVTVTGTYGDYTYSDTVEITVLDPEKIEHINVEAAIDTEIGTKVTVRGIVGPSLVNQSGFYLIDETGAIAVKIPQTDFENGLAIGQEVFVEGTVSVTKDGGGQLCIDNAAIVANLFGKTDYSTESFITGKTFEEIVATPDSVEATTQVYVVKATVSVTETNHYSTISLTSNGSSLTLYSSSANQYSWLKEFANEEVTLELALCDWNAKGLKGCVLAVITEDGKICNELNFTTGK